MLICAAALVAVRVRADTNSIQLQYGNFAAPVEAPPGETFRERFKAAFDPRVDELFADRFHPFNMMKWSMELADGNSDHLRERTTSSARNTMGKSVVYGMREAAVDMPILRWLDERQGLLADFLRNSVGSVAEESVAPVDVSYRPIERSWWERLSESGRDVHFGLRPFSPSPYAFLSLGIKDGDNLLFLGHLRYHYRSFAEHLVELALSVPLTHGLAIDLGASYQLGPRGAEERLAVKLFKEFKSGGILHVGVEARQHPAFFAGIAFPW